jgi:hypothetical protein
MRPSELSLSAEHSPEAMRGRLSAPPSFSYLRDFIDGANLKVDSYRLRGSGVGGAGVSGSQDRTTLFAPRLRPGPRQKVLVQRVWASASPGRIRTLDSHASRLRRKLGPEQGTM